MLTIIFCEKCKQNLCKVYPALFDFFEFICDQYFHDTPVILSYNSLDYDDACQMVRLWNGVKWLEDQNYIVSTESSHTTIQVKPLGFDKSGQTIKIYCFCKDENDGVQWE